MSTCFHCRGPITGAGHAGRPWPGTPAASYCCFGCLSLGEQRRQEVASPASGWKLDGLGVRLGVGILVVGQSMIFGLALNLHDDVPQQVRWFAQSLILGATLLVIALLGGPLFRAAWHELRCGRLTIEALFLLTMAGAMAASLQAHFTGRGKVYFEVVSVLLVVYTLGKLIGARSRAAALAGSRAWAGQLNTCRLVDGKDHSRVVPVGEVLPGDVVEVNPGETVAVDGVIRDGTGFMSEAPVSGEPFAVVRRPGDRVLAGVASHDATFRIEATAKGTERQVDRLLAAVEQARDRPLSLQSQADRLGRVFFPLVVLTALGTFGYWAFFTDRGWESGLFNAMSVLLIACPCVIGLATPIVIWSALGRLAERGLIVRSGDAVERLAEVDSVLLDKTGTLTDERFALLDIVTTSQGDERAKLLGWVSLIEERSRHPVARPFAELPRPFTSDDEPRVVSLRTVAGCGVEAEIEEASGTRHTIQIGTPQWIAKPSTMVEALRAAGHRVDIAVNGELAAVAVVAERLRDSVPETLAGFGQLGLPVEVLTGDTHERAATLGLPSRAALLPDDKRTRVDDLKRDGGKPLMVGDGINDASALASSHVGIALSSGTDLAVGAAAVTLYHDDLRVLPWAVELSRAAVRAVRRNLLRAVSYNVVGMTLAACGVLHPVVAALLMVVSSLSLIFSATQVSTCEPGVCSPVARCTPGYRLPPLRGSKTIIHAVAFALQGVAFLLLVGPVAVPLVVVFILVGSVLAWLWDRWSAIPHTLDMCFGMLSLGNLGMLLGWWADSEFAPLQCAICCTASGPISHLWMWVGMLTFANIAMLGLGCRPQPLRSRHALAMFTGGNVGMVLGMAAGGWCAAQLHTEWLLFAVLSHFTGMTLGMLAGMLLGTWLVETLLVAVRSTVLADEVISRQPEADHDNRVADVVAR